METAGNLDNRELLHKALSRRAESLGYEAMAEGLGHVDGLDYYLDIISGKGAISGRRDWCVAVIYVPADNSVGILTREHLPDISRFQTRDKVQSVVSYARNYTFDATTIEAWLDGWFAKSVQEELAKF